MFQLILEDLFSSWSVVFVDTKERQDKIVKRIFELSLHRTLVSSPVEHVPLRPEEMLPVVSDVDNESPQAPHIGRGGNMRIVSPQNLRSQVADSTNLGGDVIHGGRGLT